MHKRLVHLALAVAVLCFAFEEGYGAPPAPVAYWSFDGDGLDASGNHNDAALYGKATYTLGFYGQAAQFHGNGDYFQVANNPAIQLRSTQQFSVAAYVQLATLNQQNILIHGLGGSTWASWFLGVLGGEPDATLYPGSFVFGVRSKNSSVYTGVTAKAVAGRWVHLATTYDGATLRLYVDGVLQSSAVAPLPYNSAESLYLGGNPGRGFSWYGGLLDEVYIFNQALTADEVKGVMQGPIQPQLAHGPDPARGAIEVPQDVTLSWAPGQHAGAHDVYLGKTFADVDNASRVASAGVLAGQAQAATTYTPPEVLDFGQTYYWRIDEVNNAPNGSICKGNVWSFTVEPYSYPLTTGITATASGAQLNQGPEKTIDGSGLTGDLHGTDATTMWLNLSLPPIWIQYRFDRVYALDKLLVWNSNQAIEASGIVSLGTKDVTVEYSVDGAKWVALPGVPRFAKAPGTAGYAANTTVNFGGAMAKYVKLTINSSWMGVGVMASTGLSEVRFYCTPVQARLPQPVAGATGQGVTTTLKWHPGRDVIQQQVYFGADPSAVAQGTVAAQAVTACTYDPGILAYGTTYYWRVDEIGTAGAYPGEVWSFTTQEFTAVDDFESYNDTDNRLPDTWIDGLADGQSGAQVGYLDAPFAEQTVIHGGCQSMPLAYDNSKTPFYSEATRDLGTAQDWTGNGVTHLHLWFRGYPATGMATPTNTPASLYLTVTDKAGASRMVVHPNASATVLTAWTEWRIALSDLTDVSLTAVQKITLGVGDKNSPKAGGTGLLYFDDIGFGHPLK